MARFRVLHRVLFCVVILFVAAAPVNAANPAIAQGESYHYANGLILAPGISIPVYKINTITVNGDGTVLLTRQFSGIYDPTNPTVQSDSYLGHARFTGLNEKNNTILEQYSATGGFYAFEPNRAFGDGSVVPNPVLDPTAAQQLTCQFLLQNQTTLSTDPVNLQIPGLNVKCDNNFATNPLYKFSTETLSGQQNTPGAQTTNTPLRIMTTVPILVNTSLHSQVASIPMGGPGGHISMIFDDTNPKTATPALDSNFPGLQAVAMPAYGRSLTWSRNVNPVDPALAKEQVLQRVKQSYPNGTNIQVPDPVLAYFVTDAAEPQVLLEPDLFFSGVSVDVLTQTIVLKDIILPGVESGPGGLGPTITILSPNNGDLQFTGKTITLKGSINDGQAPYDYDWQLDDGTSLGGGTLNNPGELPALNTSLPPVDSKSGPGSQAIHLVVTDSEGATRQQVVSLVTPMSIFVPIIANGSSGNVSTQTSSQKAPILMPDAVNYRFGVEYGSDYPPYGTGGSDLGGVPPDANGLSSALMGMGWPRAFNWYNSLAWEIDWRDCSLGGDDCSYGVDRADYVYYSGHGNNGGIAVPSNNHAGSWADGSNARFQAARWVGFSSCLTLRAQWLTAGDEPIRRWFNSFQGAHMLLGFNSLMADIAFGPRLVDNMRIPSYPIIGELPWAQRTIAEAWVQTAFEMNAGKPAYIYATSTTVDPIGNKLPKVGDPLLPRPYPVYWFFWVWWNE